MELPRQVRDYRDDDPLTHGVDRGQLLYDRLGELGVGVESSAVLDVGCGYGGLAIAAARRGASVTALDADPANVAVVEQRLARGEAERVTVLHASVLNLPLRDDTYDLATMIGVLEWVGYADLSAPARSTQVRALNEVRRVLRPGGRLVIGTKNRLFPRYAWRDAQLRRPVLNLLPRRAADWWARRTTGGPYRAFIYSLWGWRRLLAAGGFRLEEAHVPLYTYQYPLGVVPVGHRGSVRPLIDRARARASAEIFATAVGQGAPGRTSYYEVAARLGLLRAAAGTFLLICAPDLQA